MNYPDSDLVPFAFERAHRSDRLATIGSRPAQPLDAAAVRRLRGPEPSSPPMLTSLARRWCDQFGAKDAPRAVCLNYPRIANRLALCWPDPTLTKALLHELLVDRRGGRKGFPTPVLAELKALDLANVARLRSAPSNELAGTLRF